MIWTVSVPLTDVIRQAVMALAAHRLRTALSTLGIVCGVASVMTALAIGEGARRAALTEIGALGVENVIVQATGGLAPAGTAQAASALTVGDVEALAHGLPGASDVTAVRAARTEVEADGRHADGMLVGVARTWRDISGLEMASGRWLSSADQVSRARVAVLGAESARALLGERSPVGAYIRAGGTWYLVVGVLQERSSAGTTSTIQTVDVDRSVLVPLGAMDVAVGKGDTLERVHEIVIRVGATRSVERAAEAAASILERRHGDTSRFQVVVPRELLRARLRARRTFNTVLIGSGLLALLISGVGIMNIMMASVAERTHEIGIRRALGARRRDITAQFAAEAAALCLGGGLLGVPLGMALSGAVAVTAGWPVSVSVGGVLLSLVLALAVGLGFGIIPARAAAGVQPMEALRAS